MSDIGMAAQRGQGSSMTPGSQPLSFEQMRRTWALVDILTSLKKRRTNHPPPTAELIIRKFDTLPMPALDALSVLVESTIADRHGGLGQSMVCGIARAVRSFPEDTAAEVAYAHACGIRGVRRLRGGSGVSVYTPLPPLRTHRFFRPFGVTEVPSHSGR